MIKGTLAARVAAIAAARAARAGSRPLPLSAAELERLTADDRPDTSKSAMPTSTHGWTLTALMGGSGRQARVAELKARRDR